MTISTRENKEEGSIWIRFNTTGDWYYFPLPLEIFTDENNCTVISNQEASMYREAKLRQGDIEFELLHDDLFGNIISTYNRYDVPALEQLAKNVLDCVIKMEESKKNCQGDGSHDNICGSSPKQRP